jgi:hypothetical protein
MIEKAIGGALLRTFVLLEQSLAAVSALLSVWTAAALATPLFKRLRPGAHRA